MMRTLTNRLLQSCGWMLMVMVVLLAVALVVGRVIVWSINESQDRVNTYLRDNGFEFVALGRLEGSWQVYDPCFVVRDISIKPDGLSGVAIEELSFRVDAIGSLLQGSITVSEIDASGVRLTLLRDDSGLSVKGFTPGSGSFDVTGLRDLLSHMSQLDVTDVVIDIEDTETDEIVVQLISAPDAPLEVVRNGPLRQVFFPLFLHPKSDEVLEPSNRITLTGTYKGIPGDDDFVTELYLDAPDLNLTELLPEWQVAEQQLVPGRLQANGWLVVKDNTLDLTADLLLKDIDLVRDTNRSPLMTTAATTLRMSTKENEASLTVSGVNLQAPNFSWSLGEFTLAWEGFNDLAGDQTLGLKMAELGVDDVVELLKYAGRHQLVPTGAVDTLAALNPQGSLERLKLVFGTVDEPHFAAQLRDVSMQSHQAIPGIDRLSGLISLQMDKGYLDIDNEAFVLDFNRLFPEPWVFDSGRGRVAFQIEDHQLNVKSGLIELLHDELSAYGKLNLNLPPEKLRHTWGLTLGVLDADLLEAGRYVPNTLPADVAAWLDSAILGGYGDENGLTFHGALPKEAPGTWKSHDLYFKARDTRLQYHPDWPIVEGGTGTVEVTSYYVRSDDMIGRVYDTEITSSVVEVPLVPPGETNAIYVTAMADGPFTDGIRVLNETPLAETTAQMAKQWQGTGRVTGTLAIEVPLGERSGESVEPDVNLDITDAQLAMPEFDLVIDELKGNVRYNNKTGLYSEAFSGKTFSQPITGAVKTELHGDAGEVVINVNGVISAANLYDWSGQLLLSRAEGLLNYATAIHVPYGGLRDEAYVEASTDLVGVTFNLPYPLAKTDPSMALPFHYRQLFKADGFIVDLNLDDAIKASLKVEDGIATGGRLHFGNEVFGAVTYDGIRMSGELDFLDYEDWLLVTEELGQISDVSIQDEINAHVQYATLAIDQLMLYDLELDDVEVRVTRNEAAWVAELSNEMLSGVADVPDDDNTPLTITLQELRLSSDEEAGDPLGDVNPLEIGAVNFNTEHLYVDDQDYGSWSFDFRVADTVARFENLTGDSEGVQLQSGSLLQWQLEDGLHTSRFEGDIVIEDLAAALQQFGYASSIEGEGLKLSADMHWPGSPAMVDVETVNGQINIREGKGRFVQAEAGGALKLLGIFDFASLARRFRFDFSDVLDEGLEFTDISGTTVFNAGQVDVKERIVIDGSGGKFTVGGSLDLKSRTLDNDMIVTLPLNRTLPWYAAYSAIATGPLSGAGVMLAQLLFENQIDTMSSARYKIGGTIDEPDIEFVAIFDDDVRETEVSEATVEQTN